MDVELERTFMSLPPEKRAKILHEIQRELLKNRLLHGGRINEPVDQAPATTVRPALRIVRGGVR